MGPRDQDPQVQSRPGPTGSFTPAGHSVPAHTVSPAGRGTPHEDAAITEGSSATGEVVWTATRHPCQGGIQHSSSLQSQCPE